MMRSLCGMVGIGFLLTTALPGQDLRWTPPQRDGGEPLAPANLKRLTLQTPEVPREIKKLPQISYGEVDLLTDSANKEVVQDVRAVSPWLLKAANECVAQAALSRTPPPTLTPPLLVTHSFLIFNPASAALGSENSTPRALAVSSAVYPPDILNDTAHKEQNFDLFDIIQVDLSIDAKGQITTASVANPNLPPSVATAAVAAAKLWKFLPAHHAGVAIASVERVPILFSAPPVYSVSDMKTPPRVLKEAYLEYPLSERMRGFRGQVILEFVVTSEGTVRGAFVQSSNNPNFNEPALRSIAKWKFQPGIVDGRPVNTRVRMPINFDLQGESRERFTVGANRKNKLPEELKNDFPPQLKNAALGVYPFEELQKGTHATVESKFAVQPNGRVKFYDEPNQTLSDFDYAARAMLEEFEFVPASKNGQPNWGLMRMKTEFSRDSEAVPIPSSAHDILRELQKKEPAILSANQTDKKPVLVVSRSPIYPSNLKEGGKEGTALIEFFIDEKGHAQLPRIISATDPSFGYAAAQAVNQWSFEPLTHAGKACIVRLRVPIRFHLDAQAAHELAPPSPKA